MIIIIFIIIIYYFSAAASMYKTMFAFKDLILPIELKKQTDIKQDNNILKNSLITATFGYNLTINRKKV